VEVHITELSGCKRKWEYALLNYPRSPPHIVSLKGTILHSVLEQLIRHNHFTLEKEEVLKEKTNEVDDSLYRIAVEKSRDLIDRAQHWVENTGLNLNGAKAEVRISRKCNDFILTGQIDLHTEDALIDFKSCRRILRSNFLAQLGGYSFLLDEKDRRRERYLIFFGGREVEEVKLTGSQMEKGDRLFRDSLFDAELIIKELSQTYNSDNLNKFNKVVKPNKFITECKVSQLCAYCPYRGICSGI